MRKLLLIAALAVVLIAIGVTVVPRGHAASPLSLARAASRTLAVRSQSFTSEVEIVKGRQRFVMHVGGGVAPSVASLRVQVVGGPLRGRLRPIAGGSEVADGPFLYVHAPYGMAVNGVSWLRVPVDAVPPTSPALKSLHGLTPQPLLRVLAAAHPIAVAVPSGVVRATVAYDDPEVADALRVLTNGVQFRDLQVTAVVGGDGLVHRLRLTGVTADGSSRLRIDSRLSAFGRPVRVPTPSQGTFFDQQDPRLAA